MENKSHALIAGLFTLALLAVAILVGLWLNRDRIERVPYELATKLSIPGLSPQAAVRYRGLDVGKVDNISFDPNVPGQILVHISVNPDTPITRSTFGTLAYQGVTGIAYVQLDDDGSNPVRVPSSTNQVARIEMRPSLLDNLQNKGLAILDQTQLLVTRVNALMSSENEKAIMDAFHNVSRAANEIEAIPKQLRPTLAKLPGVVNQAERALVSVNNLSDGLQGPNGPVVKLSSTIDQIGAAAGQLESELLPLTKEFRSTMRTFNRTLGNLNDRPQSILFGAPGMTPGPGEPGFVEPAR